MNVGLLTTSYPRDERDVAGDFVRGFAGTLAARGHHVDVLAPEPREPGAKLEDAGIAVHHVAYVRPRALARTFYGAGVPDNLARDPLARLGLLTHPPALVAAAHARIARWDALVSHWALPSALAGGIARQLDGRGIPHLAVMHSADVHLLERLPGRRTFARAIESSATALWFVSDELRARFRRCLERTPVRPTHVAPMGVTLPQVPDAAERRAARAALGVEGFVVLAMARLVPIKGLDVALDALARLEDTTLLVAGEGPERERLAARAGPLGARVRWLGLVRDAEKRRAFAAADAFLLPSLRMPDGRTEGAPVTVIEAMAHGLPIVATDAGGLRTLVDREVARTVPAGDPRAIVDALRALAEDDALRARMAAAGPLRARAHDWSVLGATIERFLADARGGH